MKIKNLYIENFRHIIDTNIEFGEKLTIISGQNGTGKSSILGWIAQLCDYKKSNLRLNEKPFREDYKNVFRFCPINDWTKSYKVIFTYQWENILLNIEEQKIITTRHQKKTQKSAERYRTDFDGRGNALDYPIIYLGLKRLIPFATERKTTLKQSQLHTKYTKSFSNLSRDILLLLDKNIKPEPVKSRNKDTLAMKTNSYSHLGNSAGQDNIGQIISSLLSFQKLKDDLGSEYEGGIILIDELDASLYAGSQILLVDNLFKYASKLNLQIIFTTHSLEIIQHLEKKLGNETKINHLVLRNGKIENIINPTYEYISNKIRNQIKQDTKIVKKQLICEDKVAEYWVNNLLNRSDLKKMVKVEKGPFPFGTLISMAQSKHNIFKNIGFVLDGDIRENFKTKKIPEKTIFLPGNLRPETIMYEFIRELSDTDDFWDDNMNFTSQTCFGHYLNSSKGTHKRWFEDANNKRFFGSRYSKIFNRWKKDNQDLVIDFQNEVRKLI